MITSRIMAAIIASYFLSQQVMQYMPVKYKLKRKSVEGMIQRRQTSDNQPKLSLNECLNHDENNYIISKFYHVLENELSHCDHSSFFRNIQSLIIKEKDKTFLEKMDEILSAKAEGTYSTQTNKIRVYSSESDPNNKYTNAIKTHELIHMATTKKEGITIFCGFERTKLGNCFGKGLNEGYTELINRRYFNEDDKDAGSYQELQPIVQQIEHLVGKKEMEQFFFANDLEGLISSMEKYATREEALSLVQQLDYIFHAYGKPGETLIQEKLCRKARVAVANMCLKKYKQQFESGKINEETYKIRLFNLELFTHNYSLLFREKDKKIESAGIGETLTNTCIVGFPLSRLNELIDEYYESKKENLEYTYKPWQNKDGKGIENIIIQEKNANYIYAQEVSKGRDPREVSDEISRMLSENSPEIPSNKSIIPKK